jgi:hypothetical protein
MPRKSSTTRPYPPDFVQFKTLAYRLDLSERTVHDYVAAGYLPAPVVCGTVKLWRWQDVEAHLAKADETAEDAGEDEYVARVMRAAREKADDRAA